MCKLCLFVVQICHAAATVPPSRRRAALRRDKRASAPHAGPRTHAGSIRLSGARLRVRYGARFRALPRGTRQP